MNILSAGYSDVTQLGIWKSVTLRNRVVTVTDISCTTLLLLTELVDEAGQPDGASLVDHLPQRLRGEGGHPRDLLLDGGVVPAAAVAGGRVLVVDVGVDVVVVVAVGQSWNCG